MKINVDAYYLARICVLDNIEIRGTKRNSMLERVVKFDYTADVQKITIVSYNNEYI